MALRGRFLDAISDDLNLPRALSVAHEAVRSGVGGDAARALAADWDRVLGVGLLEGSGAGPEAGAIPVEIGELARKRDALRRAGDYRAADAVREKIRSLGYDVQDGGKGASAVRKLRDSRKEGAEDDSDPRSR